MPALAFVFSSVFKEHLPGQSPGGSTNKPNSLNTSALTKRSQFALLVLGALTPEGFELLGEREININNTEPDHNLSPGKTWADSL